MRTRIQSLRVQSLKCSVSAMALLVFVAEGQAQEPDTTEPSARDEIFVTARKRSESIQDVPISIQAFSTEQLRERGITNFEDYANFLPSVSYGTTAPGATTIVFRGAVAQPSGFSANSSATLYLDEQPVTADAQNPDIRAVDIERIEALNGPQPTTFGAGSQSGTLRILTNKPNTSEHEGYLEATGTSIAHGDLGYDVNGMVNIPIVPDEFAIRLVGFYAEEAGFVDNVLGTTTGNSSNSETVDNSDLVEDDYNSTKVYGGRISAKLNFAENWSAIASLNYQNTKADGLNNYQPDVGDLQVVRFADERRDDEWYQAALTLNGDLGFAEISSTTSFFHRSIAYDFDNTSYIARFQDSNQYLATNYYGVSLDPTFCAAPSYYGGYAFLCAYDIATTRGQMLLDQTSKSLTQETRLTGEFADSKFSWLVGAFYNRTRTKLDFHMNLFDRPTSPSVQAVHAYLGFPAPGITSFFSTADTLRKEVAVFGEGTIRLNDHIEITGGARWLHYNIDTFYDQYYLEFYNFNTLSAGTSNSEVVTLANAKYKFNDDVFVYFTRSVGIRNGGVEGLPPRSTLGVGVVEYKPDRLVNYEAGIKSTLADGRLQVNLTGFYQRWKDLQLQLEDATTTAFGIVTQNIGGATMKGIEAEFQAYPTENFQIGTAFTLLSAESDETVPFGDTGLIAISKGERLPTVANFKLTASAQYSHPINLLSQQAEGVVRFDYTYNGDSTNGIPGSIFLFGDTSQVPQVQDAYDIGNLSLALNFERVDVTFSVRNIWDERADLFIHPRFNDGRIVTNTPRNFNLGVRMRF